jgi:hypothetical protein
MKKIPLSQGVSALVDDCDYEHVMQWKWYYNQGYAVRTTYTNGKRTILMHRVILERMGFKVFAECDHASRDGVDNRRDNLRPATPSQNGCNRSRQSNNTSRHPGVCRKKQSKKWRAYINVDGKQKHLGYFDDIEEAKRVREEAIKKYHGEFAVLNIKE